MQLSHDLTTSILDKLPEQVQQEVKRFNRHNYEISEKYLTKELIAELLAHSSLKGKYYSSTYKQLKTLERHASAEATIEAIAGSDDGAKLVQTMSIEVKKHPELAGFLKQLAKILPNYWLYDSKRNEFYLFKDASYTPGRMRGGSYEPPYTSLELHWWCRGKQESRSRSLSEKEWTRFQKIRKQKNQEVTIESLLRFMQLEVPTPTLLKEYNDEINRYLGIRNNLGEQYWLTGEASVPSRNRWYSSNGDRNTTAEGDLRVVIDDEEDFEKYPYTIPDPFKQVPKNEDAPQPTCELPIHTRIRVFDLNYHRMLETRSENLSLYEYQPQLMEKLILPKTTIGLINLLMTAMASGESKKQVDLVRGKSGGLIVIASGMPGTGKTLSAEVYSEVVKRPLYTVQCSQLGLSPTQLEESLQQILQRAVRYKAVLLLDEADVYIRERGEDLEHNAMVGVFLRLLEYFNGMLFMTTNRAMIIDDAIESRSIAHLKYVYPSQEDALKIWKIMVEHFQVKTSTPNTLKELAAKYNLSGRSIKNACRLSKFMLGDGGELTEEVVASILEFQNRTSGEEGLRVKESK